MEDQKKECYLPLVKEKSLKKKVGAGVCDFCGKSQSFCYLCTHCGLTICQTCFIENQRMFTRSGVTWVCPSCLNWETL
ncbi:MAG TPA: hypothetical protein DIT22_07730 [Thermodesulfobacterium commune]|nr:hypothetical protein [Thermodesulfobacterium commune]